MTPIVITYRLTLPEFMTACNAHWSIHKQGSRTNAILGVIAIAVGLALWPFSSWSAFFLVLGLVLLLLVIGRSILWRRAFQDAKKFAGDISVTFGDEKIHVDTTDGVSDFNWSIYNGYLDTPEYVLLYLTRRSFSVIPKSAFANANSQREFMSLVDSKLPRVR